MTAILLKWYPGDHIAGFLLVVLAQATLLAGIALLLCVRLHRNAAARHLVLLSAILSVAICPVATCLFDVAGLSFRILPTSSREISSQASPMQPVTQPPIDLEAATQSTEGELVEPAVPVVSETTIGEPIAGDALLPAVQDQPVPFSWWDAARAAFTVVLLTWAGVAIVRALGIARSWWKIHAIRRGARPLNCGRHQQVLDEIRQRLGVRKLPEVTSSPAVSTPVAAGFLRPVVIVPTEIGNSLKAVQWRDVVVHEMAHAVRRDQLVVFLQKVAGAVFWIHPLIHLLNRRLAQAREEICDNYVLSFTDARSYGRTLLEFAELLSQTREVAASPGLFAFRWTLEKRVSGLLDPRRNAMIRTRTYTTLAVVAVHFCLVCSLAAVQTADSPAAMAEGDVAVVEEKPDATAESDREQPKPPQARVNGERERKSELGRLVIRYDIDGAPDEADVRVESFTSKRGWHPVRKPVVKNGSQVVVDDLPPGDYRISRKKRVGSRGSSCDLQEVSIQPRQSLTVDFVRSRGIRVVGEVRGYSKAPGDATIHPMEGAPYVSVLIRPAEAMRYSPVSAQLPVFDFQTCDQFNQFKTERLLPAAARKIRRRGVSASSTPG
ncbi:MAG: M56 family metallopeptidase [Planctomycetota bacterium]|jgi:beta-lactamase regulating signal transducer with metallopeptidase domain